MLKSFYLWKIFYFVGLNILQIDSLVHWYSNKLICYPNFINATIHYDNKSQILYYNRIKSTEDSNLSTIIDDTVSAALDDTNLNTLDVEIPEFDIQKDIDDTEKYDTWNNYAKNLLKSSYKKDKEKNIGTWKQSISGFNIDVKSFQCPGCGILFQSADNSMPGYIKFSDIDKLEVKSDEDPALKLLPLCLRCRKFKGGNFLGNPTEYSTMADNRTKLAIDTTAIDASHETSLVLYNALRKNYNRHVTIVYIMDALDLYLDKNVVNFIVERRKNIAKRVRNAGGDKSLSKLTLFFIVVNKVDLIPRDSRIRILNYVHKMFKDIYEELNLKPRHIFLTNSLTGNGVNLFYSVVLNSAEALKSKVYFVGCTNSGKSTLLNWLAKYADDNKHPVSPNRLVTSIIPGTTLRPIKIDIGKKYDLYDTPGIILANSITSHLSINDISKAIPKKHIRPTSYRIKEGESLLLGTFVRIDLEDSKPYFFTPFISGDIPVRVANRKRLCISQEAQDLSRMYPVYEYDKDGNKIIPKATKVPPEMENEEKLLTSKKFRIIGSGWKTATTDICIRGLGFITVAGAQKATIKIYTNPNVDISLREPMFPSYALPF